MRIGIIGCGLIGQKRAQAAKALGFEVAFVCDRDAGRAEALAGQFGAKVSADYQALLAEMLDLAVIATAHDTLAPITLAAIHAGKHVLVEKPAARDASELAPVVEAAKQSDRLVKVGFNHRFHPAMQKARALIASKELGDILFIRAKYGHGARLGYESEWRCKKEISGGGELIDQGSHLIDLSRWFMGELSLDYAHIPTLFWDIKVEDNCFLALSNKDGAVAWLHAGWTEWKNIFCFEIMCRTGKVMIEGLGRSYGTETLTIYRMSPEMGPPAIETLRFDGEDLSWQEELADLARAMQKSGAPCGDIHDAMANLKLIEKVYHA